VASGPEYIHMIQSTRQCFLSPRPLQQHIDLVMTLTFSWPWPWHI